MRMEAQTDSLSHAGTTQASIADNIVELSGRLTAAAEGASGAGDPALQEAMTGAVQSWQASLALVAESVHGLGANLVAASHVYTVVDETAIPAG
jgi:phage-related minor tail protein